MSMYLSLLLLILSGSFTINCDSFTVKEASINDIKLAFRDNKLTSRQLVEYYLHQIHTLDPVLRAVIEINPDVLHQADEADRKRRKCRQNYESLGKLHGIPILLKDNIATKDKLNTTAGSFALLGSVVPRDAGVVARLRKSGALILGKASLSEWAYFRSDDIPSAWCARRGQGKNPYVLAGYPCSSSSGSAISVAANMVTVSLGTETDGSILCPASFNSVVGIKPTVGLTSRAGVIPVSPRQDTVGPICRTVSVAVSVLDAIVGFDHRDSKATKEAMKYIPDGGYEQFLKKDRLQGKRLGIVRNPFFIFSNKSKISRAFEGHLSVLRQRGAILVDGLEIKNVDVVLNRFQSGEIIAMVAEFKLALNAYLRELITSPVRSLADVIAFNKNNIAKEKTDIFGQTHFLAAQNTSGIGKEETAAIKNMARLSRDGFEKLMNENKLDALVTPGPSASPVLASGGYPGISVPAGYDTDGTPIGICFGGLRGSEPKLIEIAYAFEQATMLRKPPFFKPQSLQA